MGSRVSGVLDWSATVDCREEGARKTKLRRRAESGEIAERDRKVLAGAGHLPEWPSSTLNGPPTTGTWSVGDFWRDRKEAEFVCIGARTPGTWRQITPATVTADPAGGSFPTCYPIVNVTDGALKRHAGSLSRENQVRAGVSAKVGFRGTTPTGQRDNADQAVATDLASVSTLANEVRAALVGKG